MHPQDHWPSLITPTPDVSGSSKCKKAVCSSIYFSRCHKLWDYLLIQFGYLTFPIQFLKRNAAEVASWSGKAHLLPGWVLSPQRPGPVFRRVIFFLILSNPGPFFLKHSKRSLTPGSCGKMDSNGWPLTRFLMLLASALRASSVGSSALSQWESIVRPVLQLQRKTLILKSHPFY